MGTSKLEHVADVAVKSRAYKQFDQPEQTSGLNRDGCLMMEEDG